MTTFEVEVPIYAPVEAVWAVLADIGTIAAWNPGVRSSYRSNEQEGVGACRHCDLKGRSYLKEEVVTWKPNEALTMRITKTNLPFKEADIRFMLRDIPQGTAVTVAPVYQLKYGLLGRLLDRLFVRSRYQDGMLALLMGLKRHIEGERRIA